MLRTCYGSPFNIMAASKTQLSLWFLFISVFAQGPAQLGNPKLKGTSFLDPNSPIKGFAAQSFLRENIPYIDIPDPQIQAVYYYRWSVVQRHLRYTVPGTGYILTEFVFPPSYAQAFGTIDAASGHMIDETRWLRSTFFDDDYIQVFTRGPGNSSQYTNWIQDSIRRRSYVDGNAAFAENRLEDMIRRWHEWDYTFNSTVGLYYFTTAKDAQEYSLPGYYGSEVFKDGLNPRQGPNTYRPSLNSYMVANARAIAAIANDTYSTTVSAQFSEYADSIEAAMYKYLWDPKQQFFMDVILEDNPNLLPPPVGREEVGFYPFRYGIGLATPYIAPSVNAMFNTSVFLSSYGPTTLERENPFFTSGKPLTPPGYCCFWNGQSWPFSTAHVLKSLAAIHRTNESLVTADQYHQYLSLFAKTQQKDGIPYVAESHYPDNSSWSRDLFNHSEHYFHSTNNDDVITGLFGIRPRADDIFEISPIIPANWSYFVIENLTYHGHLLTVIYDSCGTRYPPAKKGLSIYIDGVFKYNSATKISATIPMPCPIISSGSGMVNIATNTQGPEFYPMINATYTGKNDYVYEAIDGVLVYDPIPDNRWTNYESNSPSFAKTGSDTIQVTFSRPRNVNSVTLAIYSDIDTGGMIAVPSKIIIHGSNSVLATIDGSTTEILANDQNTFIFPSTTTEFIAVELFNIAGSYVGLCEIEIWVPQNNGPTYLAVDAFLTSASIFRDPASHATSTGSVVSMPQLGSEVAFSGVQSIGRSAILTLSYSSSAVVSLSVIVNQVPVKSLSLTASKEGFSTETMSISLETGSNFVTLIGGGSGLVIESIEIG